jgi:ribonuclease HI
MIYRVKEDNMKINIKTTSYQDPKSKKIAYLYEAHLIENGKVLEEKVLDSKYGVANPKKSKFQKPQGTVVNGQLRSFIKSLNKKYDCESIRVVSRKNSLDSKFINQKGLKEEIPNLKFKTEFNPKIFAVSQQLLVSKLMTEVNQNTVELTSKENNQEEYHNPIAHNEEKKNKEPKIDHKVFNDLDSFVSRMNRNKEITDVLFEQNVLKNNRLKDAYVNFTLHLNRERKRYGISFEVYKNVEDMRRASNPVFKQSFISKGERNEATERCAHLIEERLADLTNKGKNVKFNLLNPSGYVTEELYDMLTNSGLSQKIEITKERTKLSNKNIRMVNQLMNMDIHLHLERLRDPNTVAIWTDGSGNDEQNISGSGVFIKHQNEEIKLKETNEGKKSSTYAEFKALYMALKEVSENPRFKDKKIMVVCDNDSMSYCIRNHNEGIRNQNYPFLNKITDILDKNDLNIHFHNVKSHIYEKVSKDNHNRLYDFKYNNEADELAREAAGHCSTKEAKAKRNRARKERRSKARSCN